jgi:uncharacterized damage-inducible protein DinB
MQAISFYAREQYDFVQGSRQVLFDFCKTMAPENFIDENTAFGNTSIRNLLVHTANTYEFWIAKLALKKDVAFSARNSNKGIADVLKLFNSVDLFMSEFIPRLESSASEIEYEINGVKGMAKPFKIFSHVITHEYHHKGQILSLSRHLGYTPVDTDIMR